MVGMSGKGQASWGRKNTGENSKIRKRRKPKTVLVFYLKIKLSGILKWQQKKTDANFLAAWC